MQATADSLFNPYASPAPVEAPIQAELVEPKPKFGSLAIIFLGFILLLVGYLTSNILAISDLYQIGMGPDGEATASPFAVFGTSPAAQWLFYAVCASAAIAGCILIGSQNFNPMVAVIFFMCPIAGLVFLVATPLRIAQKHVVPVAAIYLMIGVCLAGVGLNAPDRHVWPARPGFRADPGEPDPGSRPGDARRRDAQARPHAAGTTAGAARRLALPDRIRCATACLPQASSARPSSRAGACSSNRQEDPTGDHQKAADRHHVHERSRPAENVGIQAA